MNTRWLNLQNSWLLIKGHSQTHPTFTVAWKRMLPGCLSPWMGHVEGRGSAAAALESSQHSVGRGSHAILVRTTARASNVRAGHIIKVILCADSMFCKECGDADQLCCPGASLLPELRHAACKPGLGCSSEVLLSDRKCTVCGSKGAPCCWDSESGFTCTDQRLECSGTDNGTSHMDMLVLRQLQSSSSMTILGGTVDCSHNASAV